MLMVSGCRCIDTKQGRNQLAVPSETSKPFEPRKTGNMWATQFADLEMMLDGPATLGEQFCC
jgi:hypothetical protein